MFSIKDHKSEKLEKALSQQLQNELSEPEINENELFVAHCGCHLTVKRELVIMCLCRKLKNTNNLHYTDYKNEYRVSLAIILYTLGAEEGKEQEEKIIYNRKTNIHIVIILTNVR